MGPTDVMWSNDGQATVVLGEHDFWIGAQLGIARQISSMFKGSKDRSGQDVDIQRDYYGHIIGGLAEIAVARLFRLHAPDRFKDVDSYHSKADLPFGLEVRARSDPNNPMRVRADDGYRGSKRFVKVILDGSTDKPIYVIGWIAGNEVEGRAQRDDKWGGGWDVPDSILDPPCDLEWLIAKEKEAEQARVNTREKIK